jgi:hypothetical protein
MSDDLDQSSQKLTINQGLDAGVGEITKPWEGMRQDELPGDIESDGVADCFKAMVARH